MCFLGVPTLGATNVVSHGHDFEMIRIDAMAILASPRLHMVDSHVLGDFANEQFVRCTVSAVCFSVVPESTISGLRRNVTLP
jgi:hypothetical protein